MIEGTTPLWPFITRFLEVSTILLLAAMGELLTQRSGVINVGIEGLMLAGGASAFLTAQLYGPLAGFVVGTFVGTLLGLFHSFLSVSMRVNQIISGMGVWLFAVGFVTYWADRYTGPLRYSIPRINGLSPALFIALGSLIVIWYVLSYTHFGLKIRSVGENPAAAEASGVNVEKIRYLCTTIGGSLGGFAGAVLLLSYLGAWSHLPTKGLGWLAFGLVMFSLWRPGILLAGALSFGFVWQFGISPETIYPGFPAPLPVNRMMPFLLTIIILTIISTERFRRRWALLKPEALGQPYIKE
ncbi:sugar ABC transporter permease [Candidatus Caldarchaeum subterraneum]|uniref:Sugar ABC transporter permease n=1 Tax=Caldiarchaeum subterraneum TaxID=311458 RepID=E6N5J5_CALS0|nr:sugar ABC transporter permease [Candidatus Caldarchaeum subterraneum]BAJ50390.1 sugar ABC transporter permease [Candidatus Caldarchaeum subterraneum]